MNFNKNDNLVERAKQYASEAHAGVNHFYDGHEYALHLSMVAETAFAYCPDFINSEWKERFIAACWLHDVIEDCRITYNDLLKLFPYEVVNIVYAVTNQKGRSRKERANDTYYKEINSIYGARFVKLCDRYANALYSLNSGSSMYETYAEEHYSFCYNLFGPKGPDAMEKPLFKTLNKLIYSV